MAAEYERDRDSAKLSEIGSRLTKLSPNDAIVVASSFSNMLNLTNLAEEVQLAHIRKNKIKSGNIAEEGIAATESDIEETLKRLVELGKSKEEIFDALKNQTVELVFTAHPTQSVRRSLLQKHARYTRAVHYSAFKSVNNIIPIHFFCFTERKCWSCPCTQDPELPHAAVCQGHLGGRQEGARRGSAEGGT